MDWPWLGFHRCMFTSVARGAISVNWRPDAGIEGISGRTFERCFEGRALSGSEFVSKSSFVPAEDLRLLDT